MARNIPFQRHIRVKARNLELPGFFVDEVVLQAVERGSVLRIDRSRVENYEVEGALVKVGLAEVKVNLAAFHPYQVAFGIESEHGVDMITVFYADVGVGLARRGFPHRHVELTFKDVESVHGFLVRRSADNVKLCHGGVRAVPKFKSVCKLIDTPGAEF